jgi:hypothetical protein
MLWLLDVCVGGGKHVRFLNDGRTDLGVVNDRVSHHGADLKFPFGEHREGWIEQRGVLAGRREIDCTTGAIAVQEV